MATLFAVAIIALAAAYFAARVDTLRTGAFETQLGAELEREAFSVRETLLHAAATHIRDEGGLAVAHAPLATDGRRYRLNDSLTMQVQDERGLIGINMAEDRQLARFFTSIGIPTERHARMLDGLRDYIDADDFKHLNGAETTDYLAANKPPPANDFLRLREELANVMGWEPVFAALDKADTATNLGLQGVRTRFVALFSTARHAGFNVNSAPSAVLVTLPGINPARVGALIDQRKIKPFTNLAQLSPFSNGRLDEEIIGLVGANDWRITIAKAGLPFLLECRLTMTPGDRDRPTRLKECRRRSPDVMADTQAQPNEFSRALQEFGGNLQASSAPASSAVPTETRKTNFADRDERRESSRANETPAPRWLAEIVEPARSGRTWQ